MRPQTGDAGPESFRVKVHELLRESILDAAWDRAVTTAWSQVRIADVAADVGVSRQTIYNEFGTKEQLSLALFERELGVFLAELENQFRSVDAFEVALRKALTWMLEETQHHKMLNRMMRDARSGATDGLIPIMTVRSDLVIVPVRARLVELVLERWPEADETASQAVSDLLVRFMLSEIITPTDLDRELLIDALVAMALHVRP